MVCFYWLWIALLPLFLCFGYLSSRVDCCVQLQYDLSVEGSRWFLGVISPQFCKDVMKSGLGPHALAREVPTWPRQGVHRRGRSMPRPLHVVPGASESVGGFGSPPRSTWGHFRWRGGVHRHCAVAVDGDGISSATLGVSCRELRGSSTVWNVLQWNSGVTSETRLGIAGWGPRCRYTGELFIMALYGKMGDRDMWRHELGTEGPGSTTIALRVGIV